MWRGIERSAREIITSARCSHLVKLKFGVDDGLDFALLDIHGNFLQAFAIRVDVDVVKVGPSDVAAAKGMASK